MIMRAIVCFLFSIALFFLPLSASAQFRGGSAYSELEDSETVASFKSHVSYISSPARAGRVAGSVGETETASYVYDKLKEFGVEMLSLGSGDEFGISKTPGDTIRSRNVVGVVQGYDNELADRYIVVGARMDNLGVNELTINGEKAVQVYSGANGNASGVAMMLELARMVSTNSMLFRRSVIFVGFGASREAFAGSWYFLNRSFSGAKNIDAMINLDMVGAGDDSFCAYTCSNMDMNSLLEDMKTMLQPVLPEITAAEPYPSDHRVFYANEIPSVFFSTGQYPEHDTDRDVQALLDYEGMERELEYVYNFTRALANLDDAPAFNQDNVRKNSISEKLYAYYDCDQKPTFLGRSDPRFFLQNWVYQYIKYPKAALEQGIQGRVNVQFTIEKDGSVSEIQILKSADGLLADEVERVIAASPKWKPGKVKGMVVRSYISIPVDFILEKKSKPSFGIKR